MSKQLTVVLRGVDFVSPDWEYPWDPEAIADLVSGCNREFAALGVSVDLQHHPEDRVSVRGYADLLNALRILSPLDGLGSLCLGHILGVSTNRDILEDLRRGIRRVAFAPEMVAPDGEYRKVCHNCGCGC